MESQSKYNMLPGWARTQDRILSILRTDFGDPGITLPTGLQLLATLQSKSPLHLLTTLKGATGDMFLAHTVIGSKNFIKIWKVKYGTREIRTLKFHIENPVSKMVSATKHRVFVGYCTDLTLRVFSSPQQNFKELSVTLCPSSLLCMAYNKEEDELVAGGVGCLLRWSMADFREKLPELEPYSIDIDREEWVQELKFDYKNKQLMVQCDSGIHFINYTTGRQTHYFENHHTLSISSAAAYSPRDYFITASKDGSIKVWNTIVFEQMYEFTSHFGSVTGLALHPYEPLLISSSLDGTIRIWRLDTFELLQRLDLGEPVLGLKIINSQEIAYVTENAIKIWRLNMYHSLFTRVQSEVDTLSRVKRGCSSSRILLSTQDGGVRLLSPITGATLTIVYPIATHKVVADIVHDTDEERIYMVLEGEGEALVFCCKDNPAQLTHKLQPPSNDKHIVAMSVISRDHHQHREDPEENLIFAGHRDGTISLMSAPSAKMKRPVQAHNEPIALLATSRGVRNPDRPAIGWYDRLISATQQGTFKVWEVTISDIGGFLTLQCLKTVVESGRPQHVSMAAHLLVFSMMDEGTLYVYDVGGTGRDGRKPMAVRIPHDSEDDHTNELNGLDSCPELGLFVSSSDDGIIKMWSEEGELLREIILNMTLHGVCFANRYGDILFGFENHVYSVAVANYLPLDRLEKILLEEYKDDLKETPLEFNHTLQLKFDYKNVEALPLDLEERRLLSTAVLEPSETISLAATSSGFSLAEGDSSRPGSKRKFNREDSDLHYQKLKARRTSVVIDPSPPLPPIKENANRQDENKPKTPIVLDVKETGIPSHVGGLESGDKVSEDMSVSVMKPSADGAEVVVKVDAPKPKKFYPIAPDGYIPNSVVRKVLNFKPPPDVIKEDNWKLKPVPKQVAFATDETASEIELSRESSSLSPAPFIFENESDDATDIDRQVTFAEDTKSDTESEGTEGPVGPMIPTVVCIEVGSPSPTPSSPTELWRPDFSYKSKSTKTPKAPSRAKTPTKKVVPKSPAKSAPTRPVRSSRKKPGMAITEEEEQAEDNSHWLLKQICQEPWFPRNTPKTVQNVVNSFTDVMSNVDEAVHTQICDYIVQIHNEKELGYTDDQLKSIVGKLREQLQHPNATFRKNAVRTIKDLGIKDFKTIIEIIPLLVDENEEVRKEAAEALRKLAGIDNKDKLLHMFKDMGVLQEHSSRQDEDEVLAALVETAEIAGEDDDMAALKDKVKSWMGSAAWTIDMDDTEGKTRRKKKDKKFTKPGTKETDVEQRTDEKEIKQRDRSPDSSQKKKDVSKRKPREGTSGSEKSFYSRTGKRLLPTNPDLFKLYRGQGTTSDTSDSDDHGLNQQGVHADTKLPAIDEMKLLNPLASGDDEKDTGIGTDRDSDIVSSFAPTSYEHSLPPIIVGGDNMSYTDSGIHSDAQSSISHRGRPEESLVRRGKPHLSPIKSSALVEPASSIPEYPENWREFFDRPSARQRKHLAEQRISAAESKGAAGTHLPPIQYFENDELVLQPEAGVRLLQAVTYSTHTPGTSNSADSQRSSVRVHDIPSKLSVHTTSKPNGSSKFGILNLKWVTGQPISDNESTPRGICANFPRIHDKNVDRLSVTAHTVSREALDVNFLPDLMEDTKSRSLDFAWQKPLPPPPNRDPNLASSTRKEYDHYCEYYRLLKKGMHKHTSGTNLAQSTPNIAVVKMKKSRRRSEKDALPSLTLKMMLLCKT